jgi:hypothetical protein
MEATPAAQSRKVGDRRFRRELEREIAPWLLSSRLDDEPENVRFQKLVFEHVRFRVFRPVIPEGRVVVLGRGSGKGRGWWWRGLRSGRSRRRQRGRRGLVLRCCGA